MSLHCFLFVVPDGADGDVLGAAGPDSPLGSEQNPPPAESSGPAAPETSPAARAPQGQGHLPTQVHEGMSE